jgi:multicomponent Na+:H+ antiporter subunit D
MITGVLGAAAQNQVRRILSFHIVSQIGYMVLGLALFTPLALAGSIFYIIHHIIVKTNLFLISGVMQRVGGSYQLKQLGGLYRLFPAGGVLFLISALSLGGIPPLSGFWAKLMLLRAGLEIEQYGIVAVALVVGLLTLFSMTKIWAEAFWKAEPADAPPHPQKAVPVLMLIPICTMATVTVLIGIFPSVLLDFSNAAAAQIMNPQLYIDAVLRPTP